MAKRPGGHSLIGVRQTADLDNLHLIVPGLREGVILLDPAGAILWANDAALTMHDVMTVNALGVDAAGYLSRFALRYRNGHVLKVEDYPAVRAVAGEAVVDVVVEVTPAGSDDMQWVHEVRSLILADRDAAIEGFVLIVTDITERAEAEHRFCQAFNANPAPALIARLSRPCCSRSSSTTSRPRSSWGRWRSMPRMLGVNPDAALLAVLIGVSSDFLTPIGHQNNLLVMGPGGYRFTDYARMGGLLVVLVVIATASVLSLRYG